MAAASASASASSCHRFHYLLRSQSSVTVTPSSSFVAFLKPLFLSSPIALSTRLPLLPKTLSSSLSSLPTHPFCTPFSSSSLSVPHALSPASIVEEGSVDDDSDAYPFEERGGEETEVADDELEKERSNFEDTQLGLELDPTSSPLERKREERLKLEVPSLTVKERKELASYAHSLGKKLKTQLVGKSGVTSSVATSFIETLEANELLKIKIHRSCPGELDDVVKQLEELTGSVTVGRIGRTLIIYRPSLSKLKAEEKKKHVRNLILKKQLKARLVYKSKGQAPKSSWHGSSSKVGSSRS